MHNCEEKKRILEGYKNDKGTYEISEGKDVRVAVSDKIIIKVNGATSMIPFVYCPFCGAKLEDESTAKPAVSFDSSEADEPEEWFDEDDMDAELIESQLNQLEFLDDVFREVW